MAKYIVGIIFIILVTGAGYYFLKMKTPAKTPLNTVSYVCAEGKTIQAKYYTDSVDLVLSDGRNFSLPQAMSASGARYANTDEAVVFWNKGSTALITEGATSGPRLRPRLAPSVRRGRPSNRGSRPAMRPSAGVAPR